MKQLKTTIATIIIVLCWACTATAQNMSVDYDNKDARLDESIMAAAHPVAEPSLFPFPPSDTMATRARADLQKNFAGAATVKWEGTCSHGYMATFTRNNESAFVVYNSKGNWVHTILNYGEAKMPPCIKEKIKNAYSAAAISYVDEVDTLNCATVYLVHITDAGKTKTIRICGDSVTEITPQSK